MNTRLIPAVFVAGSLALGIPSLFAQTGGGPGGGGSPYNGPGGSNPSGGTRGGNNPGGAYNGGPGAPGGAVGNPPAGNPNDLNGGAPVTGRANPNSRAPLVAVLDIRKVMQSYTRAQEVAKSHGEKLKRVQEEFQKEQGRVEGLKEAVSHYKPGTDDYKRAEEAFAQAQSDLNLKAQIKKRDLEEEGRKNDFGLLSDVYLETKQYADDHGISLVFPYPNDTPDPNSPESMQMAVQRMQIMFVVIGPNITDQIVESLNRRHSYQPKQGTGPRTARGPSSAPQAPQGPPRQR